MTKTFPLAKGLSLRIKKSSQTKSNQKLILSANGINVVLNLKNPITLENLRNLTNELEQRNINCIA